MTYENYLALFAAMFVVALIPGPAVVAISSTSISGGFRRGAMMTAGLVLADCVFVLMALTGLSYVAELMGSGFVVIKYACGAYLVWMGIAMFRAKDSALVEKAPSQHKDLLAGFLLTMSNPKAIIFYLALFPTFVSLETITLTDTLGLFVCAVCAFGSVNLSYAWLSWRAGKLVSSQQAIAKVRKLAGSFLAASGLGVVLRA